MPQHLPSSYHADLSRRSICVDGSISDGRNGNKARDHHLRAALESQGWRVLTLWECEIKTTVQTGIIPNLPPQEEEIEPYLMAAEESKIELMPQLKACSRRVK